MIEEILETLQNSVVTLVKGNEKVSDYLFYFDTWIVYNTEFKVSEVDFILIRESTSVITLK